jgi:hypothetical protein
VLQPALPLGGNVRRLFQILQFFGNQQRKLGVLAAEAGLLSLGEFDINGRFAA